MQVQILLWLQIKIYKNVHYEITIINQKNL